MGAETSALVLGAGISGLAAAHALRGQGVDATLIEATERVGGTLSTFRGQGFSCEMGPSTLLRTRELEELCARAKCAGLLADAAAAAKRRFIVHRGALAPLPTSPSALAKTPLLSVRARLRLLAEPFQGPGPGPEESVAAFLRRRFGVAVADNLGDALVAGIYAGDPQELSIGAAFPSLHALEVEYGSVLKGLAKSAKMKGGRGKGRPVSFEGGFQSLAECLGADLDIRFGHRALAIRRDREDFVLRVESATGGEKEMRARRLVTALPLAASARLLSSMGDLRVLARLTEAPVSILALGYPRAAVGHPLDGFGFLAPQAEGRELMGCLFSSTLFPNCAPAERILLTAMSGGRLSPESCELSEDELTSRVHRDLAELLDIDSEPVFRAHRVWKPGIPQYTAEMLEVWRRIGDLEAANPGLAVLGNWLRGVGVSDCLRAAAALGEKAP